MHRNDSLLSNEFALASVYVVQCVTMGFYFLDVFLPARKRVPPSTIFFRFGTRRGAIRFGRRAIWREERDGRGTNTRRVGARRPTKGSANNNRPQLISSHWKKKAHLSPFSAAHFFPRGGEAVFLSSQLVVACLRVWSLRLGLGHPCGDIARFLLLLSVCF